MDFNAKSLDSEVTFQVSCKSITVTVLYSLHFHQDSGNGEQHSDAFRSLFSPIYFWGGKWPIAHEPVSSIDVYAEILCLDRPTFIPRTMEKLGVGVAAHCPHCSGWIDAPLPAHIHIHMGGAVPAPALVSFGCSPPQHCCLLGG